MIPTIEELDLDKLKTYNSDKKKSFEFLCYQLCYEQFHTEGSFTPIDDSGGGDGVEFYLTKENGEEYGWQCKFFDRLNVGGRKQQIKNSLYQACRNHGTTLKRWYLWTKLDFTKEEQSWFDSLQAEIKENYQNLDLIHVGISDISRKLARYPFIYSYFFGDVLLSDEWFSHHIHDVFERPITKKKYNSLLHSSTTAQDNLKGYLGGKYLLDLIDYYSDYEDYNSIDLEFRKDAEALSKCENRSQIHEKICDMVFDCINLVTDYSALMERITSMIKESSCITNYVLINEYCKNYFQRIAKFYYDYSEMYRSEWLDEKKQIASNDGDKSANNIESLLFNPLWTFERFYKTMCGLFSSISYISKTDVHVVGRASKGKSHLVLNIADQYKEENWPVVFLYARDFTTTEQIEIQILRILGLPTDWTFEEFAQRLNQTGKVIGVRSLIIIDGLNESLQWQTIWKDGLERVRLVLSKCPNLLLITTVRESYKEQIFDDYLSYDKDNSVTVYGLENDIEDVVYKYCDFYKIRLTGNSYMPQFFGENPLALKMFCEAHQNKVVELSGLTLFGIFDTYIAFANDKICDIFHKDKRFNRRFLWDALAHLADYMFAHKTNEVPLNCVFDKLSQDELQAIESEDLLFFREWNRKEVVIFTYDLLAGYLISKKLFEQCDDKDNFVRKFNGEWKESLTIMSDNGNRLHPLFDDILYCLFILSFEVYGFWIHTKGSKAFNRIVFNSVLGIPTDVAHKDKTLIRSYVSTLFKEKEVSYNDFYGPWLVENHPLNFSFIDELITPMTISERDLSWSTFVMNEYRIGHLNHFINSFEKNCLDRNYNAIRRNLGVTFLLWLLTSNCHKLRNDATRLLFLFGNNFPEELESLLNKAFEINDPYVIERILAVAYGCSLCMYGGNDNQRNIVVSIAKKVTHAMFSKDSTYSNCHWLINDYAIHIVKLAARISDTFSKEVDWSRVKITTHISKDAIFKWNEVEDFRDPIRMDFSNYTLGTLIPNGSGYANPPLKKKARSYLYNRVAELGWSESMFTKLDNSIGGLNYHYNRHNDLNKIDRFGKKYSWIAYYELAGILDANGMLNSDYMYYRSIWPDIDPTFPECPIEDVLQFSHHIDEDNHIQDWLNDDSSMDLNDIYFNSNDADDCFVCVYGYFTDKWTPSNRSIFTFIRPFIYKESDTEILAHKINNQSLAHRWLPEIVETHETYYGEISIFDKSTPSNWTILEFPATPEENEAYKHEIIRSYLDENVSFVSSEQVSDDLYKRGYPYSNDIMGIHVLMPTVDYNFEADGQANYIPHICKEIVFSEGLKRTDNSNCLYDSSGKLAAYIIFNKIDNNSNYHFVYLRKDVLDSYLTKNQYCMKWCVWGEKQPADNDYARIDFQQIDDYNV